MTVSALTASPPPAAPGTSLHRDYAYYRSAIAGRPLPLAYVDLELFDENVRQLGLRARGKPIRLASKSVRCAALLRRALEAGAGFAGILAYHPREALFLAAKGFEDLVVAYPSVEERALGEVARAVARGASITLMVDSVDHVVLLARIAKAEGVELPLCIDVDMSRHLPGLHFGVRRSPLTAPEKVLEVALAIRASGVLRLDGVMGYEAQFAGVADSVAGQGPKNVAIRYLKHASRRLVFTRRGAAVEALRSAGFSLRFVNGGGTGSLELTSEDSSVTELAAGSGLYAPLLFDGYRGFRHHPAAGFVLPVTRKPAPGIYTCHGGGFVASGAAGPERLPRPIFPSGAKLLPLEGAGEVQTPVAYDGEASLEIGAPVFFRHAKAGELCEHFPSLALISGGKIIEDVPTYRGEGQWFA